MTIIAEDPTHQPTAQQRPLRVRPPRRLGRARHRDEPPNQETDAAPTTGRIKRNLTGFDPLVALVDRSVLSRPAAHLLCAALRGRATILFSGAPGSGKTTLLSSCLSALVLADIDPDVAIIGEIRGGEALAFLSTLALGTTGYTTIRAGSARQGLNRFGLLCQQVSPSPDPAMVTDLIAEAVDLVVHTTRTPPGPRVSHILAVDGPTHRTPGFSVTDVFTRSSDDQLRWTGAVAERLEHRLGSCGLDTRGSWSTAVPGRF